MLVKNFWTTCSVGPKQLLDTKILELEEVVVGYHKPIAGPISFSLQKTTILGLAGPNGAGKTTLLKCLSGEARVFSGELKLSKKLKILRMPQEPNWPEEIPVNVQEFFSLARISETDLLIPVQHLLNKRLDRLSGGEKQLVRLISFLFQDADVLLLDEPTNHLDRLHRFLLVDFLEQVQLRKSLVVVSHDLEFLKNISGVVLEMAI